MGEPYIGEVRAVSFNFPPKGWAFCNGQLMGIQQNQALFAILGTVYGGDGRSMFALPNLQGRTPMHWGNGQGLPGVTIGQIGGEASHTLTIPEMAAHPHPSSASSATATASTPASGMLATPGFPTYSSTSPNATLVAGTVGLNAGGKSHSNLQPYLVLNYIIALQGVFPSRN